MRRRWWCFHGVLALALIARSALACSQCMCGAPFPADALGGVVPMQLRYGFEERYLSKENALDEGPGVEREREHRIAGFVLWRPRDQVALLARLPYNLKELREAPAGEAARQQTSRGLGDLEVTALLGLAHGAGAHAWSLGAVGGVSAPTGANSLRNGLGDIRDEHLQSGSGAWSGSGGLSASLGAMRGLFDASLLARVNGTNGRGYHYGDALLANAGYTSPRWKALQFVGQLNGRAAARDRIGEGAVDPNTGGTVVYASPGLRWQSSVGIGVDAAIQIPVLQSLHGDQEEHTTARVAISLQN